MDADKAKSEATKACKTMLEKYPNASQATIIKLAVLKFILDECGATGEERQEAVKAFMATPSYFGASANTLTTMKLVEKNARTVAMEEYTDI